jgi:hypothetical protein
LLLLLSLTAKASAEGTQSDGMEPVERDAAAEEPPLEWQGPARCPGRDTVLEQVAALAAKEDVSWARFGRIQATVERARIGWVLTLSFEGRGGVRKRVLNGASCAELAQAAAVAIVLASRADPGAAEDWDAGSSQAENGAGNTLVQTPAAAASPAPVGDAGRVAELAIPEPDGPSPILAFDVEALLDPATLGAAAFGAAAGMDLRLGAFSTGLYAVAFPSVTTRLGAGEAVAVGLWAGGARGCRRWGRGFDACVLVELGRLGFEGVGLVDSRAGHDLWAVPGLSVGFTSTPFDGFGITTRLSAFHPLVRGRFRVDDSEIVHRIPFVGLRAAVGIDLPVLQ